MIWLGAAFAVSALVAAFFLGRRSVTTTGSPTPPSAQVAVDSDSASDSAAQQAITTAQAKAQEVLHASDADVSARIQQLRERGRSGE